MAAHDERTQSLNAEVAEHEGAIPGWTIPLVVTFVTGGTACFAMGSKTGFHGAASRWLIAGCAALGLVLGTAAWLGHAWQRRRIARTAQDPVELLRFVGVKTIPLAVITAP